MAVAEGRPVYVALDWVERHCVVPDGFRQGRPFRLYQGQGDYLKAFYTVRDNAVWDPANPVKAPAFVYRRGMNVGPQKLGKDPLAATHICLEAVGPALFGGWAGPDEGYVCADVGCRCGWEYAYDEGEPKGMLWPTPLIQITAVSEGQTDNTYNALRPMIDLGPLSDLIPNTGEAVIRLPGGGRIERVTSSAPSRLGQPLTHASQGEVGLWTERNGMTKVADTQRRNLAGMGGRSSANTNAWDPAEHSYAQRTWEAVHPKEPGKVALTDVLISYTQPPAALSFSDRRERRRILRAVYPPDVLRENGGHLDLDSIEAEAVELLEADPAQAERFFGNKLVKGGGRAFDIERWNGLHARVHDVADGALITLGFDGSKFHDHASLIATDVAVGYQWPIGIWRPEDHGGEIPVEIVDAAVAFAFKTFRVWRLYGDPPYWETALAGWAGTYGKDVVLEWWTNRTKPMAYATRAWDQAQRSREVSHCPADYTGSGPATSCRTFSLHVGNATRHETPWKDAEGVLWYAEKESPKSADKMDSVPAAVLSWEARNDAIAAGALNVEGPGAYSGRSAEEILEMLVGA